MLTESFEFLWCPLGNRIIDLFVPRGRQVNRGIHETLAADRGRGAGRGAEADIRPIQLAVST